jgi:hypothetical protein
MGAIVALVAGLLLYFAPAIVAWNKRSFGSVMAINFFWDGPS